MHAQEVRGKTPAAATPARAGEIPFLDLKTQYKALTDRCKGLCGGAATPESLAMSKRLMSLPMSLDLGGDDQDKIAGVLRAAVLA